MIGLFPLRPGIFVCHDYNSGKTVISSKYNILGVFKFVMMNDHKWLVGCM